MKKLFIMALCAFIIFTFPYNAVASTFPMDIDSYAAVVMDVQTGQVIYGKNMNEKLFPASITKILTCALALSKNPSDESVEMTDDAIWSVGRDTTHIALTPGEIVPVKDLLNATMIQSANDAANGLALYVSGDLNDFAQKMTDTAHQIGAVNTTFKNANGLPNGEHITTAYDMALITRWALQINGFRELFGKTIYTMPPTNLQKDERTFYKKHKMMNKNDKLYYEYITGGKLGWTEESLHTSVTLAQKDGLELICVTMKSKEASAKFNDIENLLDYAFLNFNNVTFPSQRFSQPPIPLYENEKEIGTVSILPSDITILKPSTVAKADIKIDLNLPIHFEDPNKINPTVKFIIGNEVITEVPLDYTVSKFAPKDKQTSPQAIKQSKPILKPWILFTVAGISFLIALLFLIRSYNIIRRNKREKIRQRLEVLKTVENNIIRENNEKNRLLFPNTHPKNIKERPSTSKRIKR